MAVKKLGQGIINIGDHTRQCIKILKIFFLNLSIESGARAPPTNECMGRGGEGEVSGDETVLSHTSSCQY